MMRNLTAGALATGLAVVFLLLPAAGAPAAAQSAGATVTVEGGQLAGAPSSLGEEVMVFRGVPFAAPPVGELRWRPPQPAAAWEGVRDATEAAPACIQNEIPVEVQTFYNAGVDRMSEDCLYLNVWTAAEPDDAAPVMVWIHGGGLAIGNSADITYDGTRLAQRGVVLVTINYRLAALGYLAHPLLSAESEHGASGNYGTLDQVAALDWIQRNIAAFGGDPSRVLIFGESAGSWSVNHMMATPLARGLFHAAIGESGGSFGSMGRAQAKADIEAAGERFVEALLGDGVAPSLEAMRAASPEDILGVAPELVVSAATVDGWVFPDTVYNIFAAGEQHDVPVIVGSNADEMSILGGTAGAETLEQFRETTRTQYGEHADAFFETFPASTDEEAQQAFMAGGTDATFGWEMRTWARLMETVSSPAYLYFFSRVPPAPDAELYGAYHTAEIPYVFDNFGVSPHPYANRDYTDTDRLLSDILASYWVNMAATGNPNSEGLPEWPAYDPEADAALHIDDTITVEEGIRKERLDFFDRYYAAQREGNN
ncbi:MAG: carboxylesterase family protein [Acidobacteria bacterium]|nr:carboxylesterase family protein [Acidobacteriota bacterium]